MRVLILCGLLVVAARSAAAFEVFACQPEWAALVREIGGEHTEAFSATTARQDVHYIQARPSLIARMRTADLVVCSGAGLEAGWLPVLLRRAGNARVQPGRPGYVEASGHVPRLGVPVEVDRARGDIHPEGNPHVHLDPRNIAAVAQVLAKRMAAADPGNAAGYRARLDDFDGRWRAATARWEAQGAPLAGMPVVVHHNAWVYLAAWLGLEVVAELEPRPGLPPTTGHLAELLGVLAARPARAIIRAPYKEARPSEWLAGKTGIPAVVLPYTVGGSEGAGDLFGLFDDTLARLLEVVP